MAMKKVLLSDIAQRCGTSVSTVSRVLSGDTTRRTSDKKRLEILKTAEDLGWFESRMKIKRPLSVAVLFLSDHESMLSPFFSEILEGIKEAALRCESHDVSLSILSHYDDLFFSSFENGSFDCAILLGRCRKSDLDRVRRSGVKLVYAGLNPVGGMDEVVCDAREATGQMFDHLCSLGHREIAFIGPCDHDEIENEFRFDGYREAIERHSMQFDSSLASDSYLSSEDGYRATGALFSTRRPSALICANDILALGALKWLADNGIRVPDEVSVAGFDNIEASAYLNVPLTTVDVPKRELGRFALLLACERQESGRTYNVRLTLPFKLVERQSTKEVQI